MNNIEKLALKYVKELYENEARRFILGYLLIKKEENEAYPVPNLFKSFSRKFKMSIASFHENITYLEKEDLVDVSMIKIPLKTKHIKLTALGREAAELLALCMKK